MRAIVAPWALGRIIESVEHLLATPTEDNVASSSTEFARVLRGYEPEAVDKFVQKLRVELLAAKNAQDQLQSQVAELQAQINQLNIDIQEVGRPTFAGLGSKLESTLRTAEEQASRLISRAEADAYNIVQAAEREADAQRETLAEEARVAREEVAALRARETAAIESQIRALIEEARSEAAGIVAEAQAEAVTIRGESATEAIKVKASARLEADAVKAAATRTEQELALVLINKREKNVDVSDKIVKLLKLQVENAARVDEMATELLERHQQAVLETDKYIETATIQLTRARAAKSKASNEAKGLIVQAEAAAAEIAEKAASKSKSAIAAANKKATAILAEAEKRATEAVRQADEHIASLRVEREAIGQSFEGLRLLLSQASDVIGDTAGLSNLEA